MRQTNLWREEAVEVDGSTTFGVTIESPDQARTCLWYRVPAKYSSLLTRNCNPFVAATLFTAMRGATPLRVHGEVSPSLLRNLEEFQTIWACWRPGRYTKIEVIADIEREQPTDEDSTGAIVAFSGGVDSCFTAFRHAIGSCGRLNRQLKAGLMVHGFDIPLNQGDVFERAARKSAVILESLGVGLIPVATNFRELGQDWKDVYAAATASCLMLFQQQYRAGLIASSKPYQALVSPSGSQPLTDRLLSSDSFEIIHDGAAFTRSQKISQLANWPEALQGLRVCWQGPQKDGNCGRCEKCVRTILNFRVTGLSLPKCFEQDVSDAQILSLEGLSSAQVGEFEQILLAAKNASISESWVRALRKCIQRDRRRSAMKARLRPIRLYCKKILSRNSP